MNGSKKRKRRAYVARKDCVACGCCVKCVGCGRCARECPASVIEIREVEA